MKLARPAISTFSFCALAFSGLAFVADASAAIITPKLNTFTLTNTSADGSVALLPDGLSFDLTGGNTGSGLPGFTDFTTTAQSAGTMKFHYAYATLDPSPTYDFGGYLLGTTRFQLADTDGQKGLTSFAVAKGQAFGFYVGTQDNTGEPGVFSITLSQAVSAVPEPSEYLLLLSGIAALAAIRRKQLFSVNEGELQ